MPTLNFLSYIQKGTIQRKKLVMHRNCISRLILTFLIVLFKTVSEAHAGAETFPNRSYSSQTIWELPDIPDEQIDIGLWALIVAKEYDGTVNIEKYLQTLDSMAMKAIAMVGPRDIDMVKLAMTKMYLYDSGDWNRGAIFSYDLDDPLGEKPGAHLLTTYLDTHKGNCVSMPTLFLALIERVDETLPIHGVSAPLHLFCRMRDRQSGQDWNVETTNGGHNMRNEWVIEQNGISQIAIDSGVYLNNLTKKEFLAEIIGTLVYRFRHKEDYERALRYADLMLRLNSKSPIGLVQKGALLDWLAFKMHEKIMAENRSPDADEKRKLKLYHEESEYYIARAMALGWQPETPEARERYLEIVNRNKNQLLKSGEKNEERK